MCNPKPNPLAAKAVNDALVTDGLLDRLIDVIGQHRTARLREARQVGTMKTSGLLARFETEYEILLLVEEIFRVDLDDDREAIADECMTECDYDLRRQRFGSDVPVVNYGAAHPDDPSYAWRVGL